MHGIEFRLEFLIGLLGVVSLRDAGDINADVMRRVERDIDLEELRESG